jgi:hypothetical protein
MKKIFVCFTAVMAVALCLTSCKKEEKTNSMQFRATMETSANDNSKTTLNGTNIEWVAGDEVTIYGLEQSGTYTAQPESSDPTTAILTVNGQPAQGRPYCAIYPSSLGNSATSFTLPAEQVTVDGSLTNFPMYAKSYDENLAFKNLCGVLKIHLEQEGAMVSRIVVTAATEINGNYKIDNSGELPSISYVDGGSFTTTLICTTPQDITNGKDFYVIMPAGSYSGLNIKIQNAGYGVEKNVPESTTIEILRSKYSTLGFSSLNMPIPPDDDHPWGLYSVSSSLQVWIAPGNVQYKRNEGNFVGADGERYQGTWRFAEHQWDYCGITAYPGNVPGGNSQRVSDSWIDLFGWGTSGYDGISPQPANSYFYYRELDNHPILTYTDISGTYYDWGTFCFGNGWRTFTQAEVYYLVNGNKRTGKTGGATVNGVHGQIFVPDLWNGPRINTGKAYTSNVLDVDDWAVMESYGAVFLPITNYRSGGNFTSNQDAASYWTSSISNTNGGWGNADNGPRPTSRRLASTLRIYGGNTGLNTGENNECSGLSAVRLVKDYVPANSK